MLGALIRTHERKHAGELKIQLESEYCPVYLSLFLVCWTFVQSDSRSFLARAARRELKWLWEGQKTFMPKNINDIAIIITLEGIEKI